MSYSRGVGAIGDWLELLLYRFHGFNPSFNQDRIPTFEPLSSFSLSKFLSRYNETIQVEE